MKLKELGSYSIGFDLGTGSVGWAVITEDGELPYWKGRPVWGARTFSPASTAEDTRLKRSQRRRYVRRRWRLDLLQSFFRAEMERLDPEFFNRLNQSRLLPKERGFHSPLFNGTDFTEQTYYERFPSMSHLRAWLMTTSEKADLRFIYLALHNIVKHRGNFIQQDNHRLSAEYVDLDGAVQTLVHELQQCAEYMGADVELDVQAYVQALSDTSMSSKSLVEALKTNVRVKDAPMKSCEEYLAKAIVGYKADFSAVLLLPDLEHEKITLRDDEKIDELLPLIPEDVQPLFNAVYAVFSARILKGILRMSDGLIDNPILKGMDGKTISFCRVREFEKYHRDLQILKSLVKQYCPEKYTAFFRGATYPGTTLYDRGKAEGYTKYNEVRKSAYDDFKNDVIKLLKSSDAITDERYRAMVDEFEERTFLRRQKTSDNGSIPYQLHLEEFRAILANQGKHYPFLLNEMTKLESLVTFRIPYYVGPLPIKGKATRDAHESRFAWSERREGKEQVPITPWNWDEVVDKNKAAQDFIRRMTNDCTYLVGQPVLPKSSLLYEEYCVLNELNGATFSEDGDKAHRFESYSDRQDIIKELFKQKRTVTYAMVEDWLKSNNRVNHGVQVRGGQGDTKFESSLNSYRFFCKDVFKAKELDENLYEMVEEIILWSTLFEDRKILKEELERKYGDYLNAEQIKTICKRRFSGWGRLSYEFLAGIKTKTDNGPMSIIDILREGDPNAAGSSRPMVMMEVLHNEHFGFEQIIEEANREYLSIGSTVKIEDLPGSPAIRRSVNQAMRIMDEIVGMVGHAPNHVFVEVTRSEDEKKKGKRTSSRYDEVKAAVAKLGKEFADVEKEFKLYEKDKKAFDDERLMLYFLQGGKCMYSGKPLDIYRLSDYQIDHIIPQAYIKDNSLDNKVLVLSSENQNKSNHLLVSRGVRNRMKDYWKALYNAGAISKKKFDNLMRDSLSAAKVKGFIARQLVETSQSVKLLQMMISASYQNTRVIPIRASLSSDLKKAKHYYKCRDINDFHHAHDALIAAELGRFLVTFHGEAFDNSVAYAKKLKSRIEKWLEDENRKGNKPGSNSYFIDRFVNDKHIEINATTGEVWQSEFECERIRRYLNYKQVFLTRMPMIDHGAFWDETIYSPRGPKKKLSLSLKNDLSTNYYGGYSGEQYAYFYCYEALDKKGVKKIIYAGVTARDAQAQHLTIEDIAARDCESLSDKGAPYMFIRVLREKIYKKQLCEINGEAFLVTGEDEARCAIPPAFNQNDVDVVQRMLDEKAKSKPTEKEFDRVYATLCKLIIRNNKRLQKAIKLQERSDLFYSLSYKDKKDVIKALLSLINARKKAVDLTLIKGAANCGELTVAFSKEMNTPHNFAFIDQSVTGMYERKTYIDEL
ncbi:type II CRISPR RNA-guided endonuclease Cas9 [Collinsella sp. zg1085]|uniref:type II CRISPR RNA-guided endonuclease Cas9 n=1 Tax=Collinsella sp. zg1085 TaxID=2844380 RepID=UPI001C0B7F1B|nr:type II CRISPR RNA-guided endonuclease Cas9 [Collinsella sp. zg1085]QWT17275.1 type II CRISPR RNA-guided endonuclease Cas9 [Collinsella sp. zg1085]